MGGAAAGIHGVRRAGRAGRSGPRGSARLLTGFARGRPEVLPPRMPESFPRLCVGGQPQSPMQRLRAADSRHHGLWPSLESVVWEGVDRKKTSASRRQAGNKEEGVTYAATSLNVLYLEQILAPFKHS